MAGKKELQKKQQQLEEEGDDGEHANELDLSRQKITNLDKLAVPLCMYAFGNHLLYQLFT